MNRVQKQIIKDALDELHQIEQRVTAPRGQMEGVMKKRPESRKKTASGEKEKKNRCYACGEPMESRGFCSVVCRESDSRLG